MLMVFIFLSLYFLGGLMNFIYLGVIFLIWFLEFSWVGGYFVVEGFYNWLLFYMSFFIFLIVMMFESYFSILILSFFLIVVSFMYFFVVNFFFFYVLFEFSLIPVILMILGYGMQIEKISSVYYLMFYSIITSFPFLYIYFKMDYFISVVYLDLSFSWDFIMLLVLGFLMKFPIYFLHYWLPKVHVESPTSGSMLLAGLLLKFGTLGFSRLLGIFQWFSLYVCYYIAFMGMLICSFVCLFQSDVKSFVAYSSIVHMSFLFMCLLIFSLFSKFSSLLMMIIHGYISVVLFMLVGEFFYMSTLRLIYYFNSLFVTNHMICLFLSVYLLINSGFPLSLSFYSEILGLFSAYILYSYSFWIFFLYFMFSFYYSLFLLILSYMGKNFMNFSSILNFNMLPFFMMSFNLFFLFLK